MPWRTFRWMLRRTRSRLVVVRPAVIRSIESRNRVRRRSLGNRALVDWIRLVLSAGFWEGFKGISERTYIPFRGPSGNVQDWRGPFLVSGEALECGCSRAGWAG